MFFGFLLFLVLFWYVLTSAIFVCVVCVWFCWVSLFSVAFLVSFVSLI